MEIIAQAAEEKQAQNIKIFDLRKKTPSLDYLIICSSDSQPQLRAIEKEIDRALRQEGVKGYRWEGKASSGWLILDLGDIIVQVLSQDLRNYYKLEELWEDNSIIYHY